MINLAFLPDSSHTRKVTLLNKANSGHKSRNGRHDFASSAPPTKAITISITTRCLVFCCAMNARIQRFNIAPSRIEASSRDFQKMSAIKHIYGKLK